jgi:hypothetical protein
MPHPAASAWMQTTAPPLSQGLAALTGTAEGGMAEGNLFSPGREAKEITPLDIL